MKRLLTILTLLLTLTTAFGHEPRLEVTSLDGRNTIALDWSDGTMHWSAYHDGIEAVSPSRIQMTTSEGTWGEAVSHTEVVDIEDEEFNGAVVRVGSYAIELRAYATGVAYRFISLTDKEFTVVDELAEFALNGKDKAWIPYVNFRPDATSDYATQFETSFENIYTVTTLKDIDWRRLIFAPIVVERRNGLYLWISEANLEDYPGMFLSNRTQDGTIDTEFAPLPDIVEQGGHNMLQGIVKSRKPYIAECRGKRNFPWRVVAIGDSDIDIANSRLIEQLADECRLADTSWIKPGKVAWEWWNDWGLEGVDFEPGINNQTYKYYIDFASRYGIEYVILDEGWSVTGEADLMKVVPEIDVKELVDYAAERNVGIILWAGYWALNRDIEGLCKHYSELGVKGFKVDFLDRDDQAMVKFVYDLAEIAARYKLLVDYHGIYKPTGLQYTYPNAINFEGVHGLETMKWLGKEHDQLTYDVTIPFIRNVAGPVDYTPGAMRNAPRQDYAPDYSRPMSQGTRCHQLAMYVIYDQPLAMLCDSPTEYEKEPEFTQFLAEIPTTWHSREINGGAIGEYVTCIARTDDAVYLAGLNGNKSRKIIIEIPEDVTHNHMEVYSDGDELVILNSRHTGDIRRIKIGMSPGCGYVVRLTNTASDENVVICRNQGITFSE